MERELALSLGPLPPLRDLPSRRAADPPPRSRFFFSRGKKKTKPKRGGRPRRSIAIDLLWVFDSLSWSTLHKHPLSSGPSPSFFCRRERLAVEQRAVPSPHSRGSKKRKGNGAPAFFIYISRIQTQRWGPSSAPRSLLRPRRASPCRRPRFRIGTGRSALKESFFFFLPQPSSRFSGSRVSKLAQRSP